MIPLGRARISAKTVSVAVPTGNENSSGLLLSDRKREFFRFVVAAGCSFLYKERTTKETACMSPEPDSTANRIDSVVASTQEQLDEGRRLVERSNRLAKATEEHANAAHELALETEQLLDEAQATMQRADALSGREPEKDSAE